MAARKTVYQSAQFLNSVPRHGILTLIGYGIQVRVDKGHLVVDDGIGTERKHYRLPRIGHRLKRIVVVGSDGLITLAALRWLRDQDVAFSFLERNGKVLCVTGPVGSSDAKLRRAQALAMSNGVGLEICRRLIGAKLQGQEHVLRERLDCGTTADTIAGFRNKLDSAESFDALRNLEANAAASYFREWRDLPVTWPKADLKRIPQHWRIIGSRQSPLTGGARLAVTPVHAILNYCFALLEAETRLAISALGMDAGLGLGLHTDTANRDSLAFDVFEPVRPQVEMWLLDWVAREPLRRADFFETGTGNCRLMSGMCAKLSQTVSVWGKLVAPWAEYLARTLWAGVKSGRTRTSVPPTRLTQQRRIEAKGRVWMAHAESPKADHLCRGCGKTIQDVRTNCAHCAVDDATKNMLDGARIGRQKANGPEAQVKRANTQRRNALAQHAWKSSDQAAPAARLTQRFKREAKGAPPMPPPIRAPRRDNLCRGCGKTIQDGRTNCASCAVGDATQNMLDAARIGRQTANSPEAQLKRASTQRKNALAQHAWKPSDQPAWLTDKFYSEKIQPLLAAISGSVIARQISVSRWYAGRIREGYRPHQRHWQALAKLVSVSTNAC